MVVNTGASWISASEPRDTSGNPNGSCSLSDDVIFVIKIVHTSFWDCSGSGDGSSAPETSLGGSYGAALGFTAPECHIVVVDIQ